MPRFPKPEFSTLLNSVVRRTTELASLVLLIELLIHRQKQQEYDERDLLQEVGNPGFRLPLLP
jgi:hypothetical protein